MTDPLDRLSSIADVLLGNYVNTLGITDRAFLLTHWQHEFDLVSEDDYAAAVGSSVKTLHNTPHVDLPSFVKIGRKRFFVKSSIKRHLRERMVRPSRQ